MSYSEIDPHTQFPVAQAIDEIFTEQPAIPRLPMPYGGDTFQVVCGLIDQAPKSASLNGISSDGHREIVVAGLYGWAPRPRMIEERLVIGRIGSTPGDPNVGKRTGSNGLRLGYIKDAVDEATDAHTWMLEDDPDDSLLAAQSTLPQIQRDLNVLLDPRCRFPQTDPEARAFFIRVIERGIPNMYYQFTDPKLDYAASIIASIVPHRRHSTGDESSVA